MKPNDISKYSTVHDPQVHPDATRIAVVVTKVNLEDDAYYSAVWLWDGSSMVPFTHGPADASPRWSPDGSTLAFIRGSRVEGDAAQLATMPTDGGEATVITDFGLGVASFEWRPDGAGFVVVAKEWTEEWADLDPEERARRPRRIAGPEWRFDGAGFLHDKTSTVVTLDRDGGELMRLSEVGLRTGSATWSPDCSMIAFIDQIHDKAGLDGANQVWQVASGGSDPTALTSVGSWDEVAYDPSGTPHVLGTPDLGSRPTPDAIFRCADGTVAKLTTSLDTDVIWPSGGPQWLDDGSLVVMIEDRGAQHVVQVNADGTHVVLLDGQRQITGVSCSADGAVIAVTATTLTDPGELVAMRNRTEMTLSSFNAAFRDAVPVSDATHLTVERDGFEFDVWAFIPEGEGPFPTIFNIHGGPMAQYGWGFFDEFQIELGAGYAVVATNPRGASGRGDAFMKGEVGTWHMEQPPDALDLLAALDGALDAFPELDRDRLGVMGGSYGGLISSKILSFDHRFKSAVPERGLYNFVSFSGTSDIGLWFDSMFVGQRDYANWEPLWEASPLRTAHQITTPCLVIHSDSDWRCPVEPGEQLYSVLIANGVEAEFLRFPGEGHELSRSGAPKHRVERFDAVLDWHARFLMS